MVNSVGLKCGRSGVPNAAFALLKRKAERGNTLVARLIMGGESAGKAFRLWAVCPAMAFGQGANWHCRTPV